MQFITYYFDSQDGSYAWVDNRSRASEGGLIVFEVLTRDERKHLWRTSRDRSLVGDHPTRHELLSRYEATVIGLEGQLDELARSALDVASYATRTLDRGVIGVRPIPGGVAKTGKVEIPEMLVFNLTDKVKRLLVSVNRTLKDVSDEEISV